MLPDLIYLTVCARTLFGVRFWEADAVCRLYLASP